MIFLATSVILCSLLLGSIALPLLLRHVHFPLENEEANDERIAREALARAAVKAIQALLDGSATGGSSGSKPGQPDQPGQPSQPSQPSQPRQPGQPGLGSDAAARVGARLISAYQQRVAALAADDDEQRQQARQDQSVARLLQQAALDAQREELRRLGSSRPVDEQLHRTLLGELDRAETTLQSKSR